MSFSAFNVGLQMMTFTGNKLPQQRLSSKPVAGGSFTPNTLEAAFVMRANLDYQFEKAFLDQHKAKMQNRLNELTKKIQDAYSDLLNVSMSQQVGQEADPNLRADTILDGQDVNGSSKILDGVLGSNGFEDIGIVPKTVSKTGENLNETSMGYDGNLSAYQGNLTTAQANNHNNTIWRAPGLEQDQLDANGVYADDGSSGYGRLIDGVGEVQFRTLTDRTTAAGNVAGDLNVTMRVEDDPPIPEDANVNLSLLNSVTSGLLGGPPPPTYFNQKVENENTSYKTGGFWSAVNYLYNFAPREIKYSYAVGYTVNSDEAGNDEYLIDGELVNIRDNPNDTNFDGTDDDPQGYLKKDQRVKWASFDPTEGYQHERSGTSNQYPTVVNRQKAWLLDGSDPQSTVGKGLWDLSQVEGDGDVHIVDNLIFQSGTYVYDATGSPDEAYFVNETGGIGTAMPGTVNEGGGRIVQYSGTSNGTLVSLVDSNIEAGSVFRNKVDMTVDTTTDDVNPPSATQDLKINHRGALRSSLFFNHYEVETRTVEFNNSARKDIDDLWDSTANPGHLATEDVSDDATGKVYVYGSLERSKSVDASKNYDLVDPTPNDSDPTKEITRSTGNVANSFNGEYVQSLHKIDSFNGINVVSNDPKQASPIMGDFKIGEYEGLMRSYEMSRNHIDYVAPTQIEVNAANSVPTDWHQGELVDDADPATPANGFVWFPFIEDTLYSAKPANATGTDPKTGYGRQNSPRQVIQARNTFNLSNDDFMKLQPAASWITDPSGTIRPTYEKRNFFVNVDLRGVHYDPTPSSGPPQVPKIFINGREVTDDASVGGLQNIDLTSATPVNAANNVYNLNYQLNLKDYLQSGYNTISIQASDGTWVSSLGANNYDEGIRVTELSGLPTNLTDSDGTAFVAADANDSVASGVINASIITGYDNNKAVTYAPDMSRQNTRKVQSRWQTRVVPQSTENDLQNNLIRMASSPSKTGTSSKVSNAFVQMLIDMLNEDKYRDIFKLGLMSNLNKLIVTGSANLPSGSNMQGTVSIYYDQNTQSVIVNQDKLIAKS